MSALASAGLIRQLEAIGPFDAEACMNCGVCTAACPLGIDLLPRRLFRYALLGLEDRIQRRERTHLLLPALPGLRGELSGRGAHHREHARAPSLAPPGGALMPLAVRDVVGILADNLRLRGSVLPIPTRRATAWARDLGIPRGGETVLYTGQMYQLIPYIERLVRLEQRLGDFAARPLQRSGAPRQPAGQRRRPGGPAEGVGEGGVRPGARPTWRASSAALASTSATSTRTTSTAGRWPTTWARTRRSRRTLGGSPGSSASTVSASSSPSIPTPRPCCAPSTRASSRVTTCGSAATSRCSRSAGCGWTRRSAVTVVDPRLLRVRPV